MTAISNILSDNAEAPSLTPIFRDSSSTSEWFASVLRPMNIKGVTSFSVLNITVYLTSRILNKN